MTKQEMNKKLRTEIKELVAVQIEDKKLLRKNHQEVGYYKIATAMARVATRKGELTALLNFLDEARGHKVCRNVNDGILWRYQMKMREIREKYKVEELVEA